MKVKNALSTLVLSALISGCASQMPAKDMELIKKLRSGNADVVCTTVNQMTYSKDGKYEEPILKTLKRNVRANRGYITRTVHYMSDDPSEHSEWVQHPSENMCLTDGLYSLNSKKGLIFIKRWHHSLLWDRSSKYRYFTYFLARTIFNMSGESVYYFNDEDKKILRYGGQNERDPK
jgi:hypothetical protein